jgi:hypothetical protein
MALTWLLTSSNRAVRDQATKALACLFANRLSLAARILREFRRCDDLYLTERVIAAIYGAVLQGITTANLGELAEAIYSEVFASGAPPANALLRDSALSVLQYAFWRGQLPPSVDLKVASPPYNSDWPIEYVSDELIATYTQDYGTGVFRDSIVSSACSDMGDFARYRIDPLVHHWSQAPRGFSNLPTFREVADSWIESFFHSASEEQLHAFRTVLDAAKAAGGQFSYQDTPETQSVKEAEKHFRGLIEPDTWEEYRVKAQSFIKYTLVREARWSRDQTALFDAPWARRWICKRAHDLGWTPERFGQIERYSHRGYSRHEHRLERIGKKYQWLALYELTARLADNVAMVGAYGDAQKASQEYRGAW